MKIVELIGKRSINDS